MNLEKVLEIPGETLKKQYSKMATISSVNEKLVNYSNAMKQLLWFRNWVHTALLICLFLFLIFILFYFI